MSAQKVGYVISGGIVLVTLLVLVLVLMPGGIDPPTEATTGAGKLEKITGTLDAGALITIPVEGTGAGELYDEAFKMLSKDGDYRDFGQIYEDVRKVSEPEKSSVYKPILDKLVEAAGKGIGDQPLVLTNVPINLKSDMTAHDFVYAMGQLLTKAGASTAADGHNDDAIKYFQAAYVFGERLWTNGAFVMYKGPGLAIMGDAADSMNSYYVNRVADDAKATAAKNLGQVITDISKKWVEKEKIIRTANWKTGDLVNMAKHDADRCWRIEGVMWLGAAKHNAGGRQHAAIDRWLKTQLNDSDAIYKAKAQESLDTTKVDVRLIRTD